MTDSQTSVQTNVQQVDLDIDSWLGAPGADSIVTPAKDEKPSIFSQKVQDFSFLDEEDNDLLLKMKNLVFLAKKFKILVS